MINLTDNAVKAVSRFISNSDKPAGGLRIEVTDGGCSGMQYGMKLEAAEKLDDTVIDCGDVKVFVDPLSLPMLEGISIDFIDSLEGSGFKFTNPNAVKSCACGSSFSTGKDGASAGSDEVNSCSTSANGNAAKTCS